MDKNECHREKKKNSLMLIRDSRINGKNKNKFEVENKRSRRKRVHMWHKREEIRQAKNCCIVTKEHHQGMGWDQRSLRAYKVGYQASTANNKRKVFFSINFNEFDEQITVREHASFWFINDLM